MDTQETCTALQALSTNVCALIRRGESLWYGMADDYQSKYAGSSDYDKSFKRNYYDKAQACRGIVRSLEEGSFPSMAEEIGPFVSAVKDSVKQCPRHFEIAGELDKLVTKMEVLADEKNQQSQGDK